MASSLSLALERVLARVDLTPSEKDARCAELRAAHNAYNRAWIAKRRAEDPGFADRQRAKRREWKARRLADPEARAEHNEYERQRQARRAAEEREKREKRERKNARDRAARAADRAKLDAEYDAKRAAGMSAREASEANEAKLAVKMEELAAAHRARQGVRDHAERIRLDASVGTIAAALAKRWLAQLAEREAIMTAMVNRLREAIGLPPELKAERSARHPEAGGSTGSGIMRRAGAGHYKTSRLTTGDKRIDRNKDYEGA